MPSEESHWTQHDTWPPLRLALSDENGLLDLSTAGTIIFRGKLQGGTNLIGGTAGTVLEFPDGDYNAQYPWKATDLVTPGTYDCEVEITWDAGTTPPEVETVGSENLPVLVVKAELG